jgi:hypothetical protein
MARLRTAVWTYRTLTDGWPILKIRVDPAAPLPAAVLHDEANRLFEMVRDELAEQMHTRWWESRIQTSA